MGRLAQQPGVASGHRRPDRVELRRGRVDEELREIADEAVIAVFLEEQRGAEAWHVGAL
jgi:hypothetical protein